MVESSGGGQTRSGPPLFMEGCVEHPRHRVGRSQHPSQVSGKKFQRDSPSFADSKHIQEGRQAPFTECQWVPAPTRARSAQENSGTMIGSAFSAPGSHTATAQLLADFQALSRILPPDLLLHRAMRPLMGCACTGAQSLWHGILKYLQDSTYTGPSHYVRLWLILTTSTPTERTPGSCRLFDGW